MTDTSDPETRLQAPPNVTLLRSARVLAVVSVLSVVYFTRDFTAPLVVAAMLYLLLLPIVDFGRRYRVPPLLSSGVLVFGLLMLILGPILAMWQSAMELIDALPNYVESLRTRFTSDPTTSALATETTPPSVNTSAASTAAPVPPATTTPDDSGSGFTLQWIAQRALGPVLAQTQQGLVAIMITLLTTFFLLASGRSLLNRVLRLIEDFGDKRDVVAMMDDLVHGVSRYLLTLSLINAVFGLLAGLIFWATGVPNPAMWGLAAALCNYVPYLGPIAFVAVFVPFGFLTFNALPATLIPASLFVALNILEAYVISPHIYGQRLSLHPIIVFVGLLVFAWLWGVAGAIIAVPLVMCVNLVCARFDMLRWISVLMCGDTRPTPIPGPPTMQSK